MLTKHVLIYYLSIVLLWYDGGFINKIFFNDILLEQQTKLFCLQQNTSAVMSGFDYRVIMEPFILL